MLEPQNIIHNIVVINVIYMKSSTYFVNFKNIDDLYIDILKYLLNFIEICEHIDKVNVNH